MKKPSAEQAGSVRYELERARDNLQQRYLNNDDQSAGRSSRAIFSALCLLDTCEAANKQENVDAVRSEPPPAAAGGGALDAAREAFANLRFSAYPAHGTGFVTIVEGDLEALRRSLKQEGGDR